MKQKASILSRITIILAALLFIFLIPVTPIYLGYFSIEDFAAEINNPNFHTDIQYDSVHDYRSAVKVSKTVIDDYFGPQGSSNNWFLWRSWTVRHDKENDIWHVNSGIIFPPLMFGGGYDVLIASDGKVIAVWGSK